MMKPRQLTQEWMHEVLGRAMPRVLKKCLEADPPTASDLIRLVETQKRICPPTPVANEVVWNDGMEEAA